MISGVTFRSCSGTFSDVGMTATFSNVHFLDGGRIYVHSVADIVYFMGIYSACGYPFDIRNVSKVVVTNSTFEYGYGHLYISDAGGIYTLNITDSNFHGSHGGWEAAIAYKVRDTSSIYVSRCNFTNNQQAIASGAFLTLENSSFSNNARHLGFGGAVDTSHAKITNCYFFQNRAKWGGAVTAGSSIITDTIFDSNSAMYGGAIFSKEVEATRCMFISNTADVRGGVYMDHTVNHAQ